MNKRSTTEIHRLRAKGYTSRFLKYLRYDPTLVENSAKGAYDIRPFITSETTRDYLLSQGYDPGAVDLALKLAGKPKPAAKPKRQRTVRDLVRFGNRGINILQRR